MSGRLARLSLWAFVIMLGLQLGGGLYEARIVVPQWSSAPPQEVAAAMQRSGFATAGLRFWTFVSPPVALLAIANVVVAWRTTSRARRWWLAAAVMMVLDSLATYAYFVPTGFRLIQGEGLPAREIQALVAQWTRLNYVRFTVGVAAWLAALKAFSSAGSDGTGSQVSTEAAERTEGAPWPAAGRR